MQNLLVGRGVLPLVNFREMAGAGVFALLRGGAATTMPPLPIPCIPTARFAIQAQPTNTRIIMHHSRILQLALATAVVLGSLASSLQAQGIVADHRHTDLTVVPEAAILQARQNLHIAYGHTSHGSQITDGMSGLVAFMNAKKSDGFVDNLFTFASGGSGGALDYRDFYGNFGGTGASDLGNPNRTAWEAATRTYLGTPNGQGLGSARPEINVIMWSWCGQVDGTQSEIQNYLNLMSGLERDYPGVRFVYMTGHLNGGGTTGNVTVRNNQIRDYCRANNKVLFDFADIESYDPDGLVNYMEFGCDDGCSYSRNGASHNWAIEWQNSHTQNVDWYDCGAAHSQPLNANRKAYAAWWLWARLGGWNPVSDTTPPSIPAALHTTGVFYNSVALAWSASADPESGVTGYRIYRDGTALSYTAGNSYTDTSVAAGTTYSYTVRAINGAALASADSTAATAITPLPTDTEAPSVPQVLHAVTIGTDGAQLAWSAATDNVGVTGYRVYRDGSLLATVTGTSFDDANLTPATSYSYRVSARDAAGNESEESEPLTVQTADPADTEPPSVPTGLTVGATTSTTVQLSWTPSTDNNGVAGYYVYRDAVLAATVTGTSFVDAGRTASTTYTYRVSAFDASGNESAQSVAVTARTLDPGQVQHTVRLQGAAQSADAFLSQTSPTSNYGATSYVSAFDHFAIRFVLPDAVSNRRIVSAKVGFYVWAQSNYQPNQYMTLHRVTRAWEESSATWNGASTGTAWTTPGGDYAERVGSILQLSGAANWDHVFYPPVDVTMLVQKWSAGTVPNYGMILIKSPITEIGLKASEYSTSAAPYLEITYTEEPAPKLYELWVHGHFSDAQLADPAQETTVWGRSADPDGDGVPNLFEYALGTDPTVTSTGLGAALHCLTTGGETIGLDFDRSAGTIGVAYALERSFDLMTWEVVPEAEYAESVGSAGTDGLEQVLWQLDVPTGTTRAFYRLRLAAE